MLHVTGWRFILTGSVAALLAAADFGGGSIAAGPASAAPTPRQHDVDYLAFQPAGDSPTPVSDAEAELRAPATPTVADLRKLTPEEIQRIRFLELRAFRLTTDRPDSVVVKIPRKTIDDFLADVEGEEGWRGDAARREFRKLTPPQKLHIMARERGDKYLDRLEIQSDPEVFAEFRKHVMPMVLRGCATTGCHSPSYPDDVRFGLYKDPKKLPPTTYANFIMLNELTMDGQPVINRVQPENSLLLTFMLPEKEVKPTMRHPGKVAIRPVFQSRGAPAFKRIEKWIASLRQPAPDYGVSFLGSTPASRPAEEPASE